MSDVGPSEATSMDCGHAFCNDCWRQHLSIGINEGMSRRLKVGGAWGPVLTHRVGMVGRRCHLSGPCQTCCHCIYNKGTGTLNIWTIPAVHGPFLRRGLR